MTKHVIIGPLACALLLVPTLSPAQAFTYTNQNISTAYHEAPSDFSIGSSGESMGSTVSGIPFRQYNVTNNAHIRLQRFEIGLAYWYVSDQGIIWADSDLMALSIYLSKTA